MAATKPELKRIAGEVIGSSASVLLMKRIFTVLDESDDSRAATEKVEKLVALFLGGDQARALGQSFRRVLD